MTPYILQKILSKKNTLKTRDEGFTLVEVMVVLVIIGLLTTFVVINVLPAQDRALVSKAKADIRILEQALEMYRLDVFDYPEEEAGLEALLSAPRGVSNDRYRKGCLLYTSPSPRDATLSRMPSSA